MLAFLLAVLTFVVLLAVLRPMILGAKAGKDGAAAGRAVYRDQLREVDRDIERGLLTAAEGNSVRLEIQRRLLTIAPAEAPVRTGKARLLAAISGIVMAGGAIGLYLLLGVPATPIPSGPDAAEVARLSEQIRANPGDANAWTLYARAASRMERWDDAETAWRQVITLGHPTPEAVAGLGEILVLRQNGTVGPEAKGMFDLTLKGDPKNDVARYYLALAAAQGGDAAGALAQWQAMLDDMAPNSPGRGDVIRRMEETARASGLPPPKAADRSAEIAAMVERLANRLAEAPDDEPGWERLGRAYSVLGRGQDAANAFEKAAALKPSDPSLKLRAAEALLAELKPDDALPPRGMLLLHQIETALPDEPAVLWYLGLEAARGPDNARATDYWTRLSKILPPDGEDAKMVHSAMEAVAAQH